MKVIGVDIGGTNTELGVVESESGIVEVISFKTKNANSFDNYIQCLIDNIQSLLNKYEIFSIGIGAPNFDSQNNVFRPI